MADEQLVENPSVPVKISDSSFDEATNKYPVLVVDCWAAWCGLCRAIAPVVDELTKTYVGKVVFGKLNVDENPKTAVQFGVMSIPTLLLFKNGKEVDRIIGAIPKQSIESKLLKHMS